MGYLPTRKTHGPSSLSSPWPLPALLEICLKGLESLGEGLCLGDCASSIPTDITQEPLITLKRCEPAACGFGWTSAQLTSLHLT